MRVDEKRGNGGNGVLKRRRRDKEIHTTGIVVSTINTAGSYLFEAAADMIITLVLSRVVADKQEWKEIEEY